jgi:hypothetical protein
MRKARSAVLGQIREKGYVLRSNPLQSNPEFAGRSHIIGFAVQQMRLESRSVHPKPKSMTSGMSAREGRTAIDLFESSIVIPKNSHSTRLRTRART